MSIFHGGISNCFSCKRYNHVEPQINDAGIDSECKFILDLFLFKNFTGNESVLVKTQVHFFSNMITGIFLKFKIMPYAAS